MPVTISSIALRLADEAREPLGAAGAGEHAEGDLGEADLARALLGDAHVGGHGDLEAAADSVAVERRDHELRRVLEASSASRWRAGRRST